MTDPSQQCPSAWREYGMNGVRVCGRPVSSGRSCAASLFFFTNRLYSRVCGRAVGYQFGNPGAFNSYYVDRITISLTNGRLIIMSGPILLVQQRVAIGIDLPTVHAQFIQDTSLLVIDFSIAVHSIVNQEIQLTHLSCYIVQEAASITLFVSSLP